MHIGVYVPFWIVVFSIYTGTAFSLKRLWSKQKGLQGRSNVTESQSSLRTPWARCPVFPTRRALQRKGDLPGLLQRTVRPGDWPSTRSHLVWVLVFRASHMKLKQGSLSQQQQWASPHRWAAVYGNSLGFFILALKEEGNWDVIFNKNEIEFQFCCGRVMPPQPLFPADYNKNSSKTQEAITQESENKSG